LVPASWREHVLAAYGRQAPHRMGDGGDLRFEDWSRGYDPADWLDRAVVATRKAVFPLHGIDPGY
ncbi:MAG: acetoin utilization protein AcuC, partial [Jiangellaceae bacterium]